MLRLRAKTLRAVRRFFDELGYLEVETPILSHDIVVDAHLEPFRVHWREHRHGEHGNDRSPDDVMYLQTSPEFGMKRLLADGATAIYQITRVLRKGELGRLHNPEFTMIEWYKTGDTHHDQMAVVEELVASVYQALGRTSPARSFSRVTYDEAFLAGIGSRVLDLDAGQLAALAKQSGIVPPESLTADDRDGWLNLILAERIEPTLGVVRPTFLYDYPASQGALAQLCAEDPRVAERFELYIAGIEICNGYHELTDPRELRRRTRIQSELREREKRPRLPMENRLLQAMEAGLPRCAGVALGFDRLLMLATGCESLAEVLAFPFDRA